MLTINLRPLSSGSLDNKWSMDSPKRAQEKSLELTRLVGCNRTSFRESIRWLDFWAYDHGHSLKSTINNRSVPLLF
jgi:hypothetical protein